MMSNPSAKACMSPYSMPLCTIFTKWPAPPGPQYRYPSSAEPPWRRPGVVATAPFPGASVRNTGSSRSNASRSPPTMRQ